MTPIPASLARNGAAKSSQAIHVEPADPGSAEARALIAELDAYLGALYPVMSNHLVPPDALRADSVVFLVARLGAEAVGCGALAERDGSYGELKRMYVRPGRRRLGAGRALLDSLIERARSRGLRCVRLETGIAQPEALALYERAGFRRRGPFGGYAEDPLSLFMELPLD